MELRGRNVVVTGGNSGIGRAMAESLVKAGARVAIWGSNSSKTAAVAEEMGQLGIACDVGDEAQVDEAFATSVAVLGHVDGIITAAGIAGSGSRFVGSTYEEWRRVLRVNLDGTYFCFRAAARHLIERGSEGSLLAVSSMMAIRAEARAEAYMASKAGVGGLVRGCALELGPRGIRVNAVLPGYVETPLAHDLLELPAFRDRTLPRTPLRRFGLPSELGGIAVYFMGEASRFHTGDEVRLDGGLSLT